MISQRSEFKFLNRGFKETTVLIPGWATDYRIYSCLDLNYNYILVIKFYPLDFTKALLEYLNRVSLDKISLFGWSLGGFLATEFALENPQRINELILLSVQKEFDHKRLRNIGLKLKRNRKAYLYKFYLQCFSVRDPEGLIWFKKYLLKDYLEEMELEDLLLGLDYLSQVKIEPKILPRTKKIRIFHGEDDRIVPFKEAIQIRLKLPQADFIGLSGVGHILFLNRKFKEKFNHG